MNQKAFSTAYLHGSQTNSQRTPQQNQNQSCTRIQQSGRQQGRRNHKFQWCLGQFLWNHSGDKTGASQKQNHPLWAKALIPAGQSGNFRPDPALAESFSEKAKEEKTYLQIRLDATAPIELQRKRLNLLYTIFMNNGVDFQKSIPSFR